MKREEINGKTWVILSRRNLMVLLAKLDGHPPGSACTIGGGVDAPDLFVKAEEDDVHYADRDVPQGITPWGPMHIDTETHLVAERLSASAADRAKKLSETLPLLPTQDPEASSE